MVTSPVQAARETTTAIPHNTSGVIVKRGMDVVLGSLLLAVFSPLMVAIAVAVRLDSAGPVLFRQERIGWGGRSFTVLKFRTMVPDRRARRDDYLGSERRQRHKTPHDPRVTRIGRVLRRTSLDELPQLINVVCGEMSLVGPRPELPEIVAAYAPWQHARHLVRPGITGWWQIQGRSDKPMHEHTALDLYYVTHRSFRLDLHILRRTLHVLRSRGGAF